MDISHDISIKQAKIIIPTSRGDTTLLSCDLKFQHNKKYCIVGRNGCGKSTLLAQIASRTVPISSEIDIYYVEQELVVGDLTPYELVLSANREKTLLGQQIALWGEMDMTPEQMVDYIDLCNKYTALDCSRDESIVRKILHGMGFSRDEQNIPISRFSGGWQQRANIARGLYMQPKLLLLDEPTNHLDFEATAWLTRTLGEYPNCLIVVSHDKCLIDHVADYICEISNGTLSYYSGDYDDYCVERARRDALYLRNWEKNRSAIIAAKKKHKQPPPELPKPLRRYIPRIIATTVAVARGTQITLRDVSIGYNNSNTKMAELPKIIIRGIDLEIGPRARIALVGKNGSGKTTLLKLFAREIAPIAGEIEFNVNGTIGYYSQHVADSISGDTTAVNFIHAHCPSIKVESIREALGIMGLAGAQHVCDVKKLSGGQRARVVLAALCLRAPRVLVLDEPTNHLDIETIDALAVFMDSYNGVVIMASHNIDLCSRCGFHILEIDAGRLVQTTLETYVNKILEEIDSFV
jgi:ATP-binding cassette subfamily F protein 2